MLFSSIAFLYYFLPAVLLCYFLAPRAAKNAVLLVSSLVFYAWGEPKYVVLMVASIVLFYVCGLAIERAKRRALKKLWLGVSVVLSLALLGVFKYADFFIGSFSAATGLSVPLLKLALPIGISFYTFQCLSYTVDVYRGDAAAQKNPISFGAYVALFPQLIAGPIVRYVDVSEALDRRTHSWQDAASGIRRFIIGLAKKILLANTLGELTSIFRASGEKSVLFYWLYAASFTLHIYFDFSGYSDMAIGLGRVFGFRFPENFDYPYLSRSVTEFWRRWHRTLGSWFRDYVYIPLGGNRVSRGRWVVNILAVWMLTGLWHGAAWNFVLWGLMYALLLLLERWVPALQKLPSVLRWGYTMLVVMLGFVLFNAESLQQAGGDLAAMFGLGALPAVTQETLYYLKSYALVLALATAGATPLVRNMAQRLSRHKLWGTVMAAAEPLVLLGLLAVCTAYLVDGSFNPFLYFRF